MKNYFRKKFENGEYNYPNELKIWQFLQEKLIDRYQGLYDEILKKFSELDISFIKNVYLGTNPNTGDMFNLKAYIDKGIVKTEYSLDKGKMTQTTIIKFEENEVTVDLIIYTKKIDEQGKFVEDKKITKTIKYIDNKLRYAILKENVCSLQGNNSGDSCIELIIDENDYAICKKVSTGEENYEHGDEERYLEYFDCSDEGKLDLESRRISINCKAAKEINKAEYEERLKEMQNNKGYVLK